jgi:predicted extracellular nuclease
VQTTEGVVTKKSARGFFIQDPAGDGDPSTSDAIFVFGANTGAVVGDKVRVTGTVAEYTPTGATRSYTEFKDVTAVVKLGSGITITPTNIECRSEPGRYEGMLVRFTNPLTVNGNATWAIAAKLVLSNGRREIADQPLPPARRKRAALAAANAPTPDRAGRRHLRHADHHSLPGRGRHRARRRHRHRPDRRARLRRDRRRRRLVQAAADRGRRCSAPIRAAAAARGRAGNVKVASANVLNFFTTFTNGTDVEGNTGQGCTWAPASPRATAAAPTTWRNSCASATRSSMN